MGCSIGIGPARGRLLAARRALRRRLGAPRAAMAVALAACLVAAVGAPAEAAPEIIGWVERVRVHPGGLEIAAKIDTGARTSSLNAEGMLRFTRDGAEWVTFEVVNRFGQSYRFEEKIVRIAKIRRHRGVPQTRPVIMLGVCLGHTYREVQVNLINRSGFNYQMLIGRRFLRDNFIVDPAKTFTVKPACQEEAAR